MASQQRREQFEEQPPKTIEQASASTPREDDVLPDNLMDSLKQAAEATNDAILKGIPRCSVEIFLPEYWDPMSGAVFSEEGDQMRFWKLCRKFSDDLIVLTGATKVTVIYPDIGVASYLKNAWGDADFGIASLNDRNPLTGDEDVVIFAAPDPRGAQDCVRVTGMVNVDVPVVMFNARLVSGDVGIGLNMRRLRQQFQAQFVTTYSIRPIGDIGTIFRRWPSQWKVFMQDTEYPMRYALMAEVPARPEGDALDRILMVPSGKDGEGGGPSILQALAGTMSSVQRFMNSLSR
jgi:hypothetical protein